VIAFAFVACGGDDDDAAGDAPTSVARGSATAAAGLIPDLSKAGFTTAVSDRVPGSTQNQDTAYAIFAQGVGGKVASIRTEIILHSNSAKADAQYGPLAEALRNPPPDLFGGAAVQADGTLAFQGDRSKSYQTTKPDGQGNFVFSDIYRMGRAVVIIYTVGPASEETASIRKQVAEAVAAKAPQ